MLIFFCFDEIFLEKKRAMLLSSHNKRYLLRHSDSKIAHKNWNLSKYDIMQIW